MTIYAVHNVDPSWDAARKRDAALAAFNGKSFDPDAEFARLKAEVTRLEKSVLTPENIKLEVEKALGPVLGALAMAERDQGGRLVNTSRKTDVSTFKLPKADDDKPAPITINQGARGFKLPKADAE